MALVRPDSEAGDVTATNITDAGLRGDGSTDNTAAWNALIASLPSTGAGIFVPPGKFVGNFVVTNKSDLRIFGTGSASVLHSVGAGLDALKLVNCHDLTIDGVRVQTAGGANDGLHLENCQRAKVRVHSGGAARAMLWAQKCPGIVLDACELSVGSGPYPAGVANPQGGAVLTWDGADTTSGCNEFNIVGGVYIVGQTPQSSVNSTVFAPGWALCLIRAEGGTVGGPVTELSAGGIYGQYCESLDVAGYYCELNPSDVEYSAGTMTVAAAGTAVTGTGTTWNNVATAPEQSNGFPGKYLVAPIGAGMAWAKVAALTDATHLTLAAQTELLQTGWGGAAQAGAAYRLVSFDLFLDQCKGGRVGANCRGGAAIALKGCNQLVLDNPLCDSLLIDGNCLFIAYSSIRTNRTNAGLAGRVVDQGARTIRGRQTNYSNVGDVTAPGLPVYTLATRPDPTLAAGQTIYVSDGGAGAVFQGSNGAAWVNLG